MATLTAVDLLIETSKSAASLKDVKQSLKDLKSAMVQVGEDSEQFNKLANAAAHVTDRLDEVNESIDRMNPDKFAGLDSAARLGAAGIQVVTASMALMGSESEDVQKALLKVQAAMAFAQAAGQVKELEKDVIKLWNTLKANPFLAIAAAVAALAIGFYEVYKALTEVSDQTKQLTREYEKQHAITEKLVQAYDREIELMQAQGKSEQDIIAVKRKKIEVQLLEAESSLKLHASKVQDVIDNDSLYESTLKVVKAFNLKLGLTNEAEKAEAEIQNNKKERAGEDLKIAEEQLKNIGDLRNQLLVLDAQEANANAADGKKRNEEKLKQYTEDIKNHTDYVNAKHQAEQDALNREREARMAAYMEAEAQRLSDLKNHLAYVDAKHSAEEKALALRKASEKQAYQQRLGVQKAFADASISLISAVEGLVKKGSAASKVLALTEIAANTAIGLIQGLRIAQQSASAAGPGAAFAFPIFYATQVAAVLGAAAKARDILKGGSPEGAGSVASGSGGGDPGAAAGEALRVISNDPTGTQPSSQFDQNGNPVTTTPIVIQNNIVESEIQAVSTRVNTIQSYATTSH